MIEISSENRRVVPKQTVNLNKWKNIQDVSLCLMDSYSNIINDDV